MEKIKYILFFYCIGVSTIIFGQNIREFNSFEDVWNTIESENPTLDVYKLNIKKATDEHKASKSFLLPTISSGMTFRNNIELPTTVLNGDMLGRPGETIYANFGRKYSYDAGITINYTILDWQKLIVAQSAKNLIGLQKAQEGYYLQNLKQQSVLLYYQTLIAQKSMVIAQKNLDMANTSLEIAQKKFDEGIINLSSFNQAKINRNNIQNNLLASEELMDYNTSQLKILLGLGINDSISLTGVLPSTLTTKEYNLNEDKIFVTYEHQIKDAELKLKNEKVVNSIKFSLNGYFGSQQFNDNFAFKLGSDNWHKQQYIGFTLSKPLFTGFSRINKVKSAKSNLQIQELNVSNARKQSEINDLKLLNDLDRCVKSTNTSYETYLLYKENLNIYESKYKEGVMALDEYLNYVDDYLRAENLYLNELSTYYNKLSVVISRN